jgi:hypothetical protein
MNMPGFTAKASLYTTSGNYRAVASTPDTLDATALRLAMKVVNKNIVDCTTIPDSITCHECNSFGPGTFDCCGLGKPEGGCECRNCPNPPLTRPSSLIGDVFNRAIGGLQ